MYEVVSVIKMNFHKSISHVNEQWLTPFHSVINLSQFNYITNAYRITDRYREESLRAAVKLFRLVFSLNKSQQNRKNHAWYKVIIQMAYL